jgi:D-sedoheptulose 7-phosphate isomerase
LESTKKSSIILNRIIRGHIEESIRAKKLLDAKPIIETSKLISKTFLSGGKIILFGNGGSAADAQHIAAEFVGKLSHERKSLPAISFNTNTSTLTAIGNDFGFDRIYERQIESLGTKKDLVIAISTSGNSKNILNAVKLAKKMKIPTVALTGKTGGKLALLADLAINVPTTNTQHIQECHIMIGHVLVILVEELLCKKN